MLGVCCRWRPSGSLCSISYHHLGAIYERSEEEGGCDGLPSLETQPNCVDVTLKLGSAAEVACHFAVSGDRLPNHTEGHRLNGRDELSRKAGLRLGKDSTGVEEYSSVPNSSACMFINFEKKIHPARSYLGLHVY